jgi:hypothetical protein
LLNCTLTLRRKWRIVCSFFQKKANRLLSKKRALFFGFLPKKSSAK